MAMDKTREIEENKECYVISLNSTSFMRSPMFSNEFYSEFYSSLIRVVSTRTVCATRVPALARGAMPRQRRRVSKYLQTPKPVPAQLRSALSRPCTCAVMCWFAVGAHAPAQRCRPHAPATRGTSLTEAALAGKTWNGTGSAGLSQGAYGHHQSSRSPAGLPSSARGTCG